MNPTGKPKPVDQVELESLRQRVAELEAKDAEIAELREQLAERDAKNEVKVLRAKVAELEAREAARAAEEGPDLGDEASDELLRKCLEEAGKSRPTHCKVCGALCSR